MRLLREPLIHFLVLGAALFLVFNIVGESEEGSTESIVVSVGRVAQLTEAFTRTWQRPPTEQELEGLIEDHVREEVYYREALAMGLDRDDTIVRRRLRQKLEFFTDDLMATVDPTDEQLQAYLDEHPDDFRIPVQLSFRQIYFNRDRRGAQVTQDAEALLARLNGAGSAIDTADLGDPLMLPTDYEMISEVEVARRMGAEFAAALPALPLGIWSGPVESGFGLHLVLIRERQSESLPPLSEIRKAVEREWRNVRRKEASDAFYNGLRDRYEVSVEDPEAGDGEGDSKLAEARR